MQLFFRGDYFWNSSTRVNKSRYFHNDYENLSAIFRVNQISLTKECINTKLSLILRNFVFHNFFTKNPKSSCDTPFSIIRKKIERQAKFFAILHSVCRKFFKKRKCVMYSKFCNLLILVRTYHFF